MTTIMADNESEDRAPVFKVFLKYFNEYYWVVGKRITEDRMFLDVLMIYNNKIFKDILKIFKNELISVGNIRILYLIFEHKYKEPEVAVRFRE